MRKNGVNVQLRPIEGGLCAPAGYKANAVACGIRKEGGFDFAMLYSEKRCAVACLYASGNTVGAPVKVSKKNMRNGYARAVLVNGGVANCIQEGGERLALSVCDLFFPYGIERGETVIASTGFIGETLTLAPFAQSAGRLFQGLASSPQHSLRFAQAITSNESKGKQFSFLFSLGDYPSKVGVVCKGGAQTSPNMATFLAFLTTDVNISSEMLQKALTAEVKETVNMLNLDGESSPNDTVCMLANGGAGNYKIACADSEYKKFTAALRAVLVEVCKATAKEGNYKLLLCTTTGAISKEVARKASKAIAGASRLKKSLSEGRFDGDSVFYTVLSAVGGVCVEKLRILFRSEYGEGVFFEAGNRFTLSLERVQAILSAEEVEVVVELRQGNYRATAYGRIREEKN